MKFTFVKTPAVIFLLLCFFSVPAHALDKGEAKKEIRELHKKAEESSKKGDLQGAIDSAEQALDTALKTFGEKARETADEFTNVANLYMYAGHPAEAEALYKKAILIETKRLGKKDLALADSFYNLAMSYAMQRKYKDARIMLKKAFDIRVKKLGEDHPDTVKIRKAQEQIYTESTNAA